jgi:hypothetical protein
MEKFLKILDFVLTTILPGIVLTILFSFVVYLLGVIVIGGFLLVFKEYPVLTIKYLALVILAVGIIIYWHKRNLDWFDPY